MTLAGIILIVSLILIAGSILCTVGYIKVSRKEAATKLEAALEKETARREQTENRPIRGYEAPGGRLLEYRSDFTYAPVTAPKKRQQPVQSTKPRRVEDVRRSEDYSSPAVFETFTWSDPSPSYTDSSNCDTGNSSSSYDSGSSSSYDSGSSGSCDTGSSW